MTRIPMQRRTLALLAVVVPLLALFIYVALRSGPLAPVAVTVVTAENRPVASARPTSARWARPSAGCRPPR